MRFNPDLARQILLTIEATPANQYPEDVSIEGVSENEILEHLELLIDGGELDGSVAESGMGGEGRIMAVHLNRVTRKGHEFLANARNDEVWSRTKSIVKSKGGAISFELLKGLVVQVASEYWKAHTGL